MDKIIEELFELIKLRKVNPAPDSYTCYLFEKGLDKILKKVGEESAEVIIAAKGDDKSLLTNEVCDLLYHLIVLLVNEGVPLNDVSAELLKRSQKIGNLKNMRATDKNT